MLEVVEVLNKVASTSSRNEKEDILRQEKDNVLLKKTFLYAYSPYKVYGLGKKSLEGVEDQEVKHVQSDFKDIFGLLDYLITVNVNDEIKSKVIDFLLSNPIPLRRLYINMILKDLRVNATDTIANKIWGNLIPSFDLMLAKKYTDYADKLNKEFIVTQKLDGIRIAIVKNNGSITFMTRQGKVMVGLVDILKEARKLPDNMVYDGELLMINAEGLSSKDLFNRTRKITGSKGIKKDIEFHMFDALPLDEFNRGVSSEEALERKIFMHNIISQEDFKYIIEVPILYIGSDKSKIDELLKQAIANDQEGVMVNHCEGKYECKRSSQLLKVKKMHTVDLLVIGAEEGTGKYKGMLGSLIVDYKGYSVGVGSGYSNEERIQIWDNLDTHIGRVIEVQYFEESSNEKGEISLRFPVFLDVREKGKEVSYY